MKNTLNVIIMLLAGTFLFQTSINYMAANIGDFENVALPPKKVRKYTTSNPTIKIDASSRDSWTLVDFSTGTFYRIGDPENDKEKLKKIKWDLGFQRTKVITNSGATNPQGIVGAANLGPVDFDAVAEAPETGYVEDAVAWGNITNKAISDWYNYRTRTHNIESKKNIYVIRTSDNHYMKVKFLNYYCKQNERDCASIMCPRAEAACITLEYVMQPNGGRFFPPSTNPPSGEILADRSAGMENATD
ncbi:MAG: HmuY family protein [Nitrospinales bacterium]